MICKKRQGQIEVTRTFSRRLVVKDIQEISNTGDMIHAEVTLEVRGLRGLNVAVNTLDFKYAEPNSGYFAHIMLCKADQLSTDDQKLDKPYDAPSPGQISESWDHELKFDELLDRCGGVVIQHVLEKQPIDSDFVCIVGKRLLVDWPEGNTYVECRFGDDGWEYHSDISNPDNIYPCTITDGKKEVERFEIERITNQ